MDRRLLLAGQADGQGQHTLVAAAEHRQRPMRRRLGQRLVVLEVVRELGTLALLAGNHPGTELTLAPQPLAQSTDQLGVLGEALHQDLAGAIQGRLGVLHRGDITFFGAQVVGRLGLRVQGGVGQQGVGQGLETRFASDLGLGAALLLVGQVEVFQALLGVGGLDQPGQLVGQLALLVDGGEHRGAALLQLAQVAQTLVELAQLGVVEPAGHLLAIAGNEGHGRPAVEQLQRGRDLLWTNGKLLGEARDDAFGGVHVTPSLMLEKRSRQGITNAGTSHARPPPPRSRQL